VQNLAIDRGRSPSFLGFEVLRSIGLGGRPACIGFGAWGRLRSGCIVWVVNLPVRIGHGHEKYLDWQRNQHSKDRKWALLGDQLRRDHRARSSWVYCAVDGTGEYFATLEEGDARIAYVDEKSSIDDALLSLAALIAGMAEEDDRAILRRWKRPQALGV
jgi:hypothetical protein